MSRSVSSSSASALDRFAVPPRPKGSAAACLSAQDIADISKRREARWRPGLADQPLHSEIFASAREASGVGFALALARDAFRVAGAGADPLAEAEDRRHVLWVQERGAIERGGRPYLHGLPEELRDRLIHVEAKTPEDALFALEEGLRCRDLACVIGEIVGNPRSLDFTASRRLSLAAEKHQVALWLVRLDAEADLSSARMRWRVEAAPSQLPRWNAEAPGTPQWKAELFRARSHAPGQWIVSYEETELRAQRPAISQNAKNAAQALGPALARQRRFWQPGGGSPLTPTTPTAPDSRHLVRATVGRSLAACARA
ncbi:MAG: recA-like protein [Pseudomonadota bacterium]